MKKYIKPCLSVMLGLLSFLTLNENLNAIWLNAVGMASFTILITLNHESPNLHEYTLMLIK